MLARLAAATDAQRRFDIASCPTDDTPRGAEVAFDEVLDALVAHNFKLHGIDVYSSGWATAHEEVAKDDPTAENSERTKRAGSAPAALALPGRTAAQTKSWATLRSMVSLHRATKEQERRDPRTVARHFALRVLAAHIGKVRAEVSEELKAKQAARVGRRSSSSLPTPTRLPPPRGGPPGGSPPGGGSSSGADSPPGLAACSPAQRQQAPRRIILPAIAPPPPPATPPKGQGSKGWAAQQLASSGRTYGQFLNPQGWPSPAPHSR